ncbi:MAG: HAD-IC family P-type ATPase [Patescibacteria group bacterium]
MIAWHAAALENIERELKTDYHAGLTTQEANVRFLNSGPNELATVKPESVISIFLRQFRSPLIYILAFASVVVFFLQDSSDAYVILSVLVFNAIIGAIQEGRAQDTLAALRRLTVSRATVLRDGHEIIVSDRELVPGDIVVLREGERVSADMRLIEANSLRTNQATLTGESMPAQKTAVVLRDDNLPVADRANMVFAGTTIVAGGGRAVVVATGINTEIGAISRSIVGINTEIPLAKDIRQLSRIIMMTVAVLSFLLFGFGVALGRSPREMFATVVSLAVSIIPEGLPLVLTLVLATGVWRMARRNALVKKLQAVEALGQAQVIAVDKTGTLTKNEMIIRRVYVGRKYFEVGGSGYEPKGELRLEGNVIDPPNHEDLLLSGKVAALTASAHAAFSEERGLWEVGGDPTEAAIGVFGQKIGFHRGDLEREWPLTVEVPFDYRLKYHAAAHIEDHHEFVTVVGAPEVVIAASTKWLIAGKHEAFTASERKDAEETLARVSLEGFRVVAFAFREVPLRAKGDTPLEVRDLVFGGFYAIEDSLRPEVPEAMARAAAAGVRVVMLTGDHRLTAQAIAKEAGIWKEGDEVLTGEEIERLDDGALAGALPGTSVFARITPQDKMRIIAAYRRRGEIIAMTGDGVNDAPSLVAADLGVAMGRIGTEVAKEAADIVLLDDNFGSIVSAIEEGRNMYRTIQKALLYLFSTSLGELMSIVGAIAAGLALPLLPVQILWLNLVTDPFMGTALALDPKDPGLGRGVFRHPNRYLIDREMIIRAILMAATMMIGTLLLFGAYGPEEYLKASSMALTVLAIFQWFNAWNCRSATDSIFRGGLLQNPYLVLATVFSVALQLAILEVPVLQGIFHTTSLTFTEWLWATGIAFSIVLVEELRKLLGRMIKTPSSNLAGAVS